MTFVKRIMMAGATILAGYAMKKMLGQLEAQAEKMRTAQQPARPQQDARRLKQDPATGVHYAED